MFLEAANRKNITYNEERSVFSTICLSILGYRIEGGEIRPDPERLRPLLELPLPHDVKSMNRCLGLFSFPLPRIDDLVNEMAQYPVFSTVDLRSAYHQVPLKDEDKPYTAFEASGCLYQFTRLLFGVTNGVARFQSCKSFPSPFEL